MAAYDVSGTQQVGLTRSAFRSTSHLVRPLLADPNNLGLTDTFTGPSYDPIWTVVGAGASIVSGRSRQLLSTAYAEISTDFIFTFDESTIYAQIAIDVTGDNPDVYMYVGKSTGNRAVIQRTGANLYFVVGGTSP